ncbi:EAL domain-containing protein [Oceanospirillum sp.]|uniref:GGDEF/EAL domain-containing response regulator n=1 Tax=Oceanospirillum sp. TaxID=2021254 RepID=UPI003A8CF2E3
MSDFSTEPTKRLLVLDDEKEICELVAEVAEMQGFSCEQCSVLSSLNELTLSPMPDILVLDLSMPDVDGIEVINHLGSLPVKPQLILMTGFERSVLDGAHKLADRLHVPVLGQLNKPISLNTLTELLKQPFTEHIQGQTLPSSTLATLKFNPEDIQTGLQQNEFIAYYQPQINLKTGKLHGAEALVRWHHPNGLIMPDDFLPLIESNQQILPLTESVIEQTLKQMTIWQESGLPPLQTSINLSAAYLYELDLPALMTRLLKRYPIPADMITFEITERIGLGDHSQAISDTLTRLRLKNFSLSIDDFGTGYSSLSQLNQLPFNEIKIDKSFVFHLLSSPISKAIVESSITLAHQLGVRCVAEGVETQEMKQALCRMGCHIGQGYLYSKALPPDEFLNWIENYISEN